jgi:hypothetical protein
MRNPRFAQIYRELEILSDWCGTAHLNTFRIRRKFANHDRV